MDTVMAVVNYVKDHWVEILAAIGGIDIALGVIVKLTPFSWDDNVYTILHNLISKLGKK